jgi:uncharacterized protein (DUF1786 family)
VKILAVDVGTGTQDVLLFDTATQPENCFKLVLPSPTMRVARSVKQATRAGQGLLIDGVTMGGGPSAWAVRDHAQAGYPVFATPDAARTLDDDLDKVRGTGVQVIAEEEAARLAHTRDDLLHLSFHDFDFGLIERTFEAYGVTLALDGVAVAAFDHGAAPPDVSDRKFRFDYLDEYLRRENRLSALAFGAESIPASMTRLHALRRSAALTGLPPEVPVMVMDTAPAAVLGVLLDPNVGSRSKVIVTNIGNFHTLAFRLGTHGIEGLFEHHTGEIDAAKLDRLLGALADSTLRNEDVFNDDGHGALIYAPEPLAIDVVTVTGPRRSMMHESRLPVYYAVPFGDMMIAGCFGLVRAWADRFPDHREQVLAALSSTTQGAPWDVLE